MSVFANTRISSMVGRQPRFMSGVESPQDAGVSAGIDVPGLELSGRISAALLGTLWIVLMLFYLFTRRQQG